MRGILLATDITGRQWFCGGVDISLGVDTLVGEERRENDLAKYGDDQDVEDEDDEDVTK